MNMKLSRYFLAPAFLSIYLISIGFVSPVRAQSNLAAKALFETVSNFVQTKAQEHRGKGKRITRKLMDNLAKKKRSLAKRHAKELAARPNLTTTDYYYLGRLYYVSGNDRRSSEAMNAFLDKTTAADNASMIQSARSFALISTARIKRPEDAERYYLEWLKGSPMDKTQQPLLGSVLAVGLFKSKKYQKAIKYALDSFEILKTFEAKTPKEIRSNEKIYMNLVEVLALSYKKSKNKESALAVLAEARVRSFALPSAALYRKVMNFVDGSRFSERKLMEKVESYGAGNPAPEIEFIEWLRSEPAKLSDFRGKIVLLDFWATWCGPCISTFPRLRSWFKKYKDKNFTIIGVTEYYGEIDGKPMTELQELDYLERFTKKYKLPYPIAIAESSEDSMKYGINAYPTTVLLDQKGFVRYIGIGAGSEEIRNLERMIKKLIKEKTVIASN